MAEVDALDEVRVFAPFVAPFPCVLHHLVRFVRIVSGELVKSYG